MYADKKKEIYAANEDGPGDRIRYFHTIEIMN